MLFGIIPIVLLFLIFNKNNSNTKSFLYSLTIWGGIFFGITEILSLFKGITKTNLLIFWIILDLLLFILAIKNKHKLTINIKFSKKTIFIFFACLIIIIADVIIVPYNWDSMTYHLPRIMMWSLNKSVAHFTTYDYRMISSPVLAEFVNLNEYVLTGSDKFFNFLQGFSFISIVILIICISKTIKLDDNVTYLSIFLFISMPIALAESLTTQVDLFSTIWPFIFVCICLDLINKDKFNIKDNLFDLVILGLSMGLGYNSKPSVCLMMAVFGIILLITRIKHKDGLKVYLISPIIIALIAFMLVLPEIIRNLNTFNSISAGVVGERQLVGTLLPNYLIINFLKNLLFQLGLPFIRILSTLLYGVVFVFSKILFADMNSSLISEDGLDFNVPSNTNISCDTAINPLVGYLLIFVILLCIIKKNKLDRFDLGCLLSYALFILILRWERFESRYLICYLGLLCVFISKKIFELNKNKLLINVSYVLCILSIIYFVIVDFNLFISDKANIKPDAYFVENSGIKDKWISLSEEISKSNLKQIAFYSDNSNMTYPIFMMCDLDRVEMISDNNTTIYDDLDYLPDALVYIGKCDEKIDYHGKIYKVSYVNKEYHVLVPE